MDMEWKTGFGLVCLRSQKDEKQKAGKTNSRDS